MDILATAPLTLCVSYAGLAAGTTTTYTTANAVTYAIGGIAYNKAAATNAATPTLDALTGVAFVPVPAGFGCAFLFAYDAAGNLKVVQGGLQALDATGAFINAPALPSIDTAAAFGYLIFKGGSTLASPWTFGASNLSSVTGATYSFKNLLTAPGRPQVS